MKDPQLNNFYNFYRKYILSNNLKEQSCIGCYMVEQKERVLGFRAIAIKIGGPFLICMS